MEKPSQGIMKQPLRGDRKMPLPGDGKTPSRAYRLFPPTCRQWAILLVALSLLALAGMLPVPRAFLLLTGPWVMGVFIMLFDWPGPARNWFGSIVLASSSLMAFCVFNGILVAEWARTGWLPAPLLVGCINAVLGGAFSALACCLWPCHCPRCGCRSLIPLLPVARREKRTHATRWCASCDEQFWKKDGVWRPERRRTWWDKTRQVVSPHRRKPTHVRRDPSSPEPAAAK